MVKRSHSGGGAGPSAAKKRYRAALASASASPASRVCGPGIFLTCVRGKERRAGEEAVGFLEEIAERLYPGTETSSEAPRHAVKLKARSGTGAQGEEEEPANEEEGYEAEAEAASATLQGEMDDHEMDALRNAAPSAPSAPAAASSAPRPAAPAPAPAPASAPAPAPASQLASGSKELDLEAQIALELAELSAPAPPSRSGGGGGPSTAKGKAKAPHSHSQGAEGAEGAVSKPRRRFEVLETGAECLRFISIAPPLDPFRLVWALMEEVERTGEARSRFIQRLSPIAGTAHADLASIEALAQKLLPRWFASASASEGAGAGREGGEEGAKRGVTYKIEPHIRSHSSLSRDDVIRVIASCVPRDAGHAAKLVAPECWVMLEGIRNVCGLGVAHDYLRFKKYNPQQLAEASRKAREARERGATQTTSAEGGASDAGLSRVAAAAGRKEEGRAKEEEEKAK